MMDRRNRHEKGGEGTLKPLPAAHLTVLQKEVPSKSFPASLTH